MKGDTQPPKLLWMDLEMTGLEPSLDRIIEVAVVITDFDFNELASYEAVIHHDEDVLNSANDWVQSQHGNSGLLDLVRASDKEEDDVQQEIYELIEQHFKEPAVLAGNSIHQDRRFIRQWWPEVETQLHYRMLDVSAFKVLMVQKYGIEVQKVEKHRSIDDVRESIAELKAYLSYMNVPDPANRATPQIEQILHTDSQTDGPQSG